MCVCVCMRAHVCACVCLFTFTLYVCGEGLKICESKKCITKLDTKLTQMKQHFPTTDPFIAAL